MKILVYRYTEHDLRSNKEYVNSYRFEPDDGFPLYFDYHAKYTFPSINEITTSNKRIISSKPAEKTIFKQEIVFSDDGGVLAYYDISKRIFYDKDHEALIYTIDQTNWLKAILRNMLGGDPDAYQLCDATKKIVYGKITRNKLKAKLFWPLSIIEKVIKVIIAGDKTPLYEIELSSLPIEKAILMIASVILEENKLSTQGLS